jgi:ESCRT-II complex subunit VPS36
LADLEVFTVKAREMVTIAKQFNNKLQQQQAQSQTAGEPEEAKFIRTSLASLGLVSGPGSAYGVGAGEEEHLYLRELAAILQGSSGPNSQRGLLSSRPMISLDELWGVWMRSRGVGM